MVENVGPLLAAIRRMFPASRFEPLAEADLAALRRQYPGIPEPYLAFLGHVGWGSLGEDNFMISGRAG
jgi:hypothetical protein